MFGPRSIFSGLSLGRVVGGISKTLGVVNQIIPIYKEAKPMIDNAKSAFALMKEFGNKATTRVLNNTEKNLKPLKDKINVSLNNPNVGNQKGPTFFQ